MENINLGRGRSKQPIDLNSLLAATNFEEDNEEEIKPTKLKEETKISNDIRGFTGSLNFKKVQEVNIKKLSEIQTDARKIENHIKESMNNLKSYYGIFDVKSKFLLKMLIDFSDNLKKGLIY